MAMPQSHLAVFTISVAADLAGMQIQNLRVYERRGLIEPARTSGGTRRYSSADVECLVRIRELLEEGLNLAGIERVLELEQEVRDLRRRVSEASEASAGPLRNA
ncbi:MerR family transcriptional regulator/heat shock protein HspR [Nocardioides daedukensis]|uniref:MerR family transcriptional regulator/heat shock protein HspR n=1 Tax=Nocardioides daedukensis TaxID=634462 RepID=A0A7Y9RVQ2_9ACTN|nr:MerR family transcriptional regulator [Nocardioides daedukensis]NYG57516.1 MerR family transcriptional regulator/heat shock protein HspR [Nocardioides daedukensis]